MSSRAGQLCYPRSNFSVTPTAHSRTCRRSLDPDFSTKICHVWILVRLAFALALYNGFLTRLSQPLGAVDTFSTACHPSQTVHLLLSLFWDKQGKIQRVVLHWRLKCRLAPTSLNNSHLHYTMNLVLQQQATVKFHGVFASHWKSLAFAPEWNFRRVLVRDSGYLVTPFMQAVIQTARHLATLREL